MLQTCPFVALKSTKIVLCIMLLVQTWSSPNRHKVRRYDEVISWAKAPALYMTMSQVVVVVVEVHFLDLAFRAQIELRNVKVKVTLR